MTRAQALALRRRLRTSAANGPHNALRERNSFVGGTDRHVEREES